MKHYFKIAVVASALMSVVGCQSTGQQTTSVEQTTAVNTQALSTFDELQKQFSLDKATFDAATELKIYSEDSYDLMMAEWNEAKEIYADIEQEPGLMNEEYSMFSSGSYAAKYVSVIASANTHLSQLKEYKKKADVVLSDAIAQMTYMQSINVAKYYPQDFSDLYNHYEELFVIVIEDDIAEAQTEQAEFLTKAKEVEIETSLTIHVTPLENEFALLSQKGFKSIAPISYGQTKAELEKTKKTVQANNRDQELITDVVAKTRFQLDHLKNITAEIKLLRAVKNGAFEQTILEFENKLLSISQAINGEDFRDQPLRIQTTDIVSSVVQMHANNNNADLEKNIVELNAEMSALNNSIETQKNEHLATQKQVTVLTQQLERNDHLINNLNAVIATYKAKEEAEKAAAALSDKASTQDVAVKQAEQPKETPANTVDSEATMTAENTDAKNESDVRVADVKTTDVIKQTESTESQEDKVEQETAPISASEIETETETK